MNTTEEAPPSFPSLRLTKVSAKFACVWFIVAVGLSPGYGSSLGMPWPIFWATWGVVSALAIVSFIGFFACKRRGEHISSFYMICPLLLFAVLFYVWNESDIVRAILHYEGAA
jgi:hypothetical protein